MSIRIALDNPPEFYTNLDFVSGRVILSLNRPEHVGNVVVKLEGESQTALGVPPGADRRGSSVPITRAGGGGGNVATEAHKLLYKVQQVYPDERAAAATTHSGVGGLSTSTLLNPGQHEFRFRFKMPLNNICHDQMAMSSLVGVGGGGGEDGIGVGPGSLLGLGGYRTMDGTRQLFLRHVKATLPPSLTGFPAEAEVRYYVKVTIQRPGLFRENWRYQVGFKFLPIEPPRPARTAQEAYARRPFNFRPRTPLSPSPVPQQQQQQHHQKVASLFGRGSKAAADQTTTLTTPQPPPPPPSIEISARLPHPSIITCHEPLPLRLLARRLTPSSPSLGPVYLAGLEIALVGYTQVRVHDLHTEEVTRWIVFSGGNLGIELFKKSGGGDGDSPNPAEGEGEGQGKGAEGGEEFEVPADGLWANRPLPNTVAPSFRTCNLSRRYEIELKVSLSWGASGGSGGRRGGRGDSPLPPQLIHLPLKLSQVEIFSGIRPPQQLLETTTAAMPPKIPPRPSPSPRPHSPSAFPHPPHYPHQRQQPHPHYPHQPPLPSPSQQHLQPRPGAPAAHANNIYDDPPPSYDEAMAADITAPPAQARPAYSGVTAENAPSTLPTANTNTTTNTTAGAAGAAAATQK